MGTRNHPLVCNQPFFVTAVTRNRQTIFRDHNAADLMLTELARLRQELRFALLGYVVMPDHIHLILVPGEAASLSQIMQLVKGRFTRAWNERRSRTGSLWQPRYYESAVRTQEQLFRWLEYIDRNPIEAGLAATEQDYPYCSAGGRLATDIEAYLGGSWGGQAEPWPSERGDGVQSGQPEAWPSEWGDGVQPGQPEAWPSEWGDGVQPGQPEAWPSEWGDGVQPGQPEAWPSG